MSHYEISYADISDRHLKDGLALCDIMDYVGQEKFDLLRELANTLDCLGMNFAMSFAGVSGHPFHAFCRTFMFDKYIAWMADPKDPVVVDSEGFQP